MRTEMKCTICGAFSSAQTCYVCESSPVFIAYALATLQRDESIAYVEGSVNLLRQIEQTLAPFPDALDALEAPRHGDEIADVLVAVRAALAHPIAAALAKNPVQDDAHRVFPKSLALIEEAQAALGAVHEIVNVEDAGYHARVDALDLIGKCEGDFLDDYEWTDGDEHYHAPSTQEMGLIRDAIAGLHADEKWVEAWDAWRALVREYHANPLHGVGTAEG